MPDLTAEALHEVVKPVWDKHPGTEPKALELEKGLRLSWWAIDSEPASTEAVTLLCEAQMTRFLADRGVAPMIQWKGPLWTVEIGHRRLPEEIARFHSGFLAEALSAACMQVPA